MIDTHAHLNYPPLAADVAGVLSRASEAGVARIVVPGTSRESSDSAVALAGQYAQVYAAVGVHPSDAHETTPADIERITTLSLNPKVVAIGEVGLDYFHFDELGESEVEARKALQKAVLYEIVSLAKEVDKPLIIHSRDCFQDLYDILSVEAKGMKTVIHCFTGSQEEADAWLALGFHLSFTGILTYKNAEALRAVATGVPWDRVMVETDAPYLAPQAFRGQTCEPAMVMAVAEQLAALKNVDVSEVDERTTSTADAFFNFVS
ncbi:MAG TPA: TatD family hydrolase [Verrucomicrobiae bacterium]|nr:TatD family hydrolase [Verrucomicrobiae bacterium]